MRAGQFETDAAQELMVYTEVAYTVSILYEVPLETTKPAAVKVAENIPVTPLEELSLLLDNTAEDSLPPVWTAIRLVDNGMIAVLIRPLVRAGQSVTEVAQEVTV